MRLGIIKVTPQLIESNDYDVVIKTLGNHFKELDRKFDAFDGLWILAGESELFDDLIEGQKPIEYVAHFQTVIPGLPLFIEFTKA